MPKARQIMDSSAAGMPKRVEESATKYFLFKIWSKELQNSINGSMSTSTLPNFNERNWRLMNLHDYKEFGKIQQTWITYSEDNVTTIGDSTKSNVYHHYLELFNPHQNAIGCARHNSSDSDFKVPCLIGPKLVSFKK